MKRINIIFDKTVDFYLAYPIANDIFLVAILWLVSKYIHYISFTLLDKVSQLNILTNIINTDVSMAGFILAALTIIVTFKSNIQTKGMTEATNALELIFSSKHYSKIVDVFKKTLIELVLCFVLLFFFLLSANNFSINTISRVNVTGILLTTMSITRSLFVLFLVLDLEKHKRIV